MYGLWIWKYAILFKFVWKEWVNGFMYWYKTREISLSDCQNSTVNYSIKGLVFSVWRWEDGVIAKDIFDRKISWNIKCYWMDVVWFCIYSREQWLKRNSKNAFIVYYVIHVYVLAMNPIVVVCCLGLFDV